MIILPVKTSLNIAFVAAYLSLGALDQGHMVVARLGCNPLGDYGGEQLASLGPKVWQSPVCFMK